jgi:uncharacterized pyridoxal phosphate-containing UPF0001 family protein
MERKNKKFQKYKKRKRSFHTLSIGFSQDYQKKKGGLSFGLDNVGNIII